MPRVIRTLLFVVAAIAVSSAVCRAAALKAFYSGSSMASDSSARTITLHLEKDGTGTYDDNSGKGDIKKRLHWFRDGKKVSIELEPAPGSASSTPMLFELKNKSLVPADPANKQLGVLGFPVLHPFGVEDVGVSSGLSTCVTGMPGPCAMRETWNTNK